MPHPIGVPPMSPRRQLSQTLGHGRVWLQRAVMLLYAALAGLAVVAFAWLSERAFAEFMRLYRAYPWAVLLWTPACTAAIVWLTRRWVPWAAGSGIPQVMAALSPMLTPAARRQLVSLPVSLAKVGLGAAGFLAGLSLGREGPSVQVAAGVLHHAQRWRQPQRWIDEQALLIAGGAAGIAAAFNAPLAGVIFAIEELSRRLALRDSGLVVAAIVLAGLMGVSAFGNYTYFGSIRVPSWSAAIVLPGLAVALVCGVLGGLFARLLVASLTGSPDRISRWRQRYPVRFATLAGLAVAVVGLVSGGATFGGGGEGVRQMLAGGSDTTVLYPWLKAVATWLTAWAGVPGGIFAPSLSIGAGIGYDMARWMGGSDAATLAPVLIAMGMAGFLAAVTQAPLTAFIIVMEMIDGRALVWTLMVAAVLASWVSRLIVRPLYHVLAHHAISRLAPMASGPQPAAVHDLAPELAAAMPGPATTETKPPLR